MDFWEIGHIAKKSYKAYIPGLSENAPIYLLLQNRESQTGIEIRAILDHVSQKHPQVGAKNS
jgi:hypothetical protein